MNFHAALRLLIFSLSGHRPEETRVHWPWDKWWSEPQVDSRDQPVFVRDPVSSAFKSLINCFLSKKSLKIGQLFSTSLKVFYLTLLLGLAGSWIGCFIMIEVSGILFILFLRWIQIVSGVSLDKISPCPDKLEHLNCSFEYVFLRVFLFWYFY